MLFNRLIIVLALWLLVVPAYSTTLAAAASQNDNTNNDSALQRRQDYQRKVDAQLHDVQRKIDDLKARLRVEKNVDQKEFNRELNDLERQRVQADHELERLKNSSEAAWQQFKPGLDSAVHDLEAAYDRAAAQFK